MALGKLDSYMQKNETGQLSYNLHKNKLKMTRDLNIVPETIKLPEENIGRTLDINQSKILYGPPPRVMEIKTKVNK